MSGRVFSYVIEHDLGFAPNPFHGWCSLACCKPDIRLAAKVGDHVIGTGAARTGLAGRLVYWMAVDEILTFDQYWLDPRFSAKRPDMRAPGRMHRYGDNIYHRDPDSGGMIQEDSFHSRIGGAVEASNLKRDTGKTDKVLIGRSFGYYGMSAPELPERFKSFVKKGPSHKCKFSDEDAADFVAWLSSLPTRGYVDRPTHWQFEGRGARRKAGKRRSTSADVSRLPSSATGTR